LHNAVAARPEWSSFVVFVTGKALAKLQKAGTEGGKAAQNNKNIDRVHVILTLPHYNFIQTHFS